MKILFFSPYAFVNVWAYPEVILAENFRQRGHDVVQVRCRGLYADFCIAMSSVNLTPRSSEQERKEVCAKCIARCRLIEERFGFQTVYLEDYVTADVQGRVDADLATIGPANWPDVITNGIPVARFAAYEYILNEKANTVAFKPEQWDGYVTHVRNAMLTAEIGQKLLDEVKPDAILAYNTNYGCNHVMCALAEQRGIPHYTEHLGRHHRRMFSEMTIFRTPIDAAMVAKSAAWAKIGNRPLGAADVALVSEHVSELMSATSPWVYTIKADNRSPDAIRSHLGIDAGRRLLLVTMASGDERFAADLIGALPAYQTPMFPTQLAWIDALIERVKDREDLFLLIRVHPREFPNKREQVTSAQARLLRQTFVGLPPNCRVNWPEDALSLHDLAKITDVCLNATSTAGLELLLFGIPVVIYDKAQFFAYPAELNFHTDSVEGYWRSIEAALEQGRSAYNIVQAFRWIAFLSNVAAIDIGEVYGRHFADRPKPAAVRRRRGVLSLLRDRVLPRKPPETAPSFTDDPFMNVEGLSQIGNGRWLAHAVEHGASSHLDALAEEIASTEPGDPAIEQAAVAAAAADYFQRVGMPADILARPAGGDAKREPAV